MKTIQLPRTALRVSQLCLGTNQFGTALDDARAFEMLDAFRALGATSSTPRTPTPTGFPVRRAPPRSTPSAAGSQGSDATAW